MDISSIEQAIQSSLRDCHRVVITAGSEFNCKNRKKICVLASTEEKSVIHKLQEILILSWCDESQGWLDNYPRIQLNFFAKSELLYSIGVINRATVTAPDLHGVLDVKEYEKFGAWLEVQGVTPGINYT